jgi:hypothetical protein
MSSPGERQIDQDDKDIGYVIVYHFTRLLRNSIDAASSSAT